MNDTHQVLAYADDVNLIGNDIWTLERNADVLLNACKVTGLAVNTGKTKYMDVGHCRGMIEKEHIAVRIYICFDGDVITAGCSVTSFRSIVLPWI